MLFELKKFVGGLLLPLPALLLVMGFALLLLWFTRRQKLAKTLLSLSWLLLLLLSLQPVADRLLKPFEQHYATYDGSIAAKYIVVLGGGYTYNPQWAPSSNLISNSLPRLTEGVRIYLKNPGSKLVFTGAAAYGNPMTSAQVASLVAQSLGVPAQDIITVDTPKDTESEARAVKQIIGSDSMILVTSANHLPRAIAFFKKQGMEPIPAPANQLAIDSPLNPWEKIYPSALYLSHSERAWYETLGRWWAEIKGE